MNTLYTPDPELNAILQRAMQESLLVQHAMRQEEIFNFHIQANQQYLLDLNQKLSQNSAIDWQAFHAAVLDKTQRDITLITKLNENLAEYEDFSALSWSLKSNKMQKILTHANEILSDPAHFGAIIQGHFPAGFDAPLPHPVIIGDHTTPFGNSNATYLSAAILEVNLALQGEHTQIQAVPVYDLAEQHYSNWVDQSAIAHVVPIPSNIDLNEIDSNFTQDFSFYFSDANTPQGLSFVHSGFAFGGHRDEVRYPDGKTFGPEDASSWIAKLAECDALFSSVDQLFTYRLSMPEGEQGFIPEEWRQSEYPDAMQAVFSPVEINSPDDIFPGQVMAFRHFETENHLDSEGDYGYTALVLGLRENGNLVTLGFARSMPVAEGFGIEETPWQSTADREMMYFDVKEVLHLDEVIAPAGNHAIHFEEGAHSPPVSEALHINILTPALPAVFNPDHTIPSSEMVF